MECVTLTTKPTTRTQRVWHGDCIWEAFRDALSRGFQTTLLSLMCFPVLYGATLKMGPRKNYIFGLKSNVVSVRRSTICFLQALCSSAGQGVCARVHELPRTRKSLFLETLRSFPLCLFVCSLVSQGRTQKF